MSDITLYVAGMLALALGIGFFLSSLMCDDNSVWRVLGPALVLLCGLFSGFSMATYKHSPDKDGVSFFLGKYYRWTEVKKVESWEPVVPVPCPESPKPKAEDSSSAPPKP